MTAVAESQPIERLPTGTRSLDAVLGGGLVTGSAALLVGDVNVNDKGMLATQVAVDLASAIVTDSATKKRVRGWKILYATTRESVANVQARAKIVAHGGWSAPRELEIVEAPSYRALVDHIIRVVPDVLIVDSIDRLDVSIDPDVYGANLLSVVHARNIACLCTTMDVRQRPAWKDAFDVSIDMRRGDGDLRVLSTTKNRFGDTRAASLCATPSGFVSVDG